MDHFSKKDMLKITGKWLIIFGMIMLIFCAYQYRLGSMYTSRMISLIGSLEHQTDVETAIFGESQEEDYQSGLQSIRDAGLEKTGEDNLYQTIISYGRNWYVVMTVILCLTGMAYDLYCSRKNAVRATKYAEQIREEERTRLQEEKAYVIKEREKMGTYMENIAHQLKTPAAGMMLGLEYLQDTEVDEQRQIRLGQCISQLERISDMTASLLRLAQIDSGKIWMKKKKENLSELLCESADAVESMMTVKNIDFQQEIPKETMLSCDAFWIREAFKNLLKNATEHTPKNGQIRTTLDVSNGQYDIRIYNSGAEITMDQREEIFDRFYQTDGDKKDSFGIGLHLSREIFRMHQGTVRVLESDETGTTFQILLPIFVTKDAGGNLTEL